MKQITLNLYTFEELSEEQKEKCLNKYRDINDDLFNAQDEKYTQPIHDLGFLCPLIYGDLSYCQGSGACFETNDFDFEKLLKDWEHPHKKWIINILNDYCECAITKNYYANHYDHERTRNFEILDTRYNMYYKHIERTLVQVQNYIEELRLTASQNLTKQLYDDLEYLRSDEVVEDCLISNNYYFDEELRIRE